MKILSTTEKGEGITELLICKNGSRGNWIAVWITLRSTSDIGNQRLKVWDSYIELEMGLAEGYPDKLLW